jgi:hypothetical protein
VDIRGKVAGGPETLEFSPKPGKVCIRRLRNMNMRPRRIDAESSGSGLIGEALISQRFPPIRNYIGLILHRADPVSLFSGLPQTVQNKGEPNLNSRHHANHRTQNCSS